MAATTIDELQVLITAQNKDFKRALSEINRDLNGTEKQVSKTSQVFQSFSRIAVTAFAAAGAAIATGLGMSIKATADLEQSLGGSEVVFGKYAKFLQDTAKESFSNMGTSTTQYLDTANKMGSLFQGAGYTVKDSMDMTQTAMQRATDVATAMGIDTGMALESIAGAAKGNFTMMDNLGVAMNDTTLNAYALEKGLGKTTQEMTNAEKVGLAMEMFLDRTAKYAGNYARENATLAGSFSTLKASFSNFMSGIEGSGEDLARALQQMTNVLVQRVPEIASTLATNLSQMVTTLLGNVDWRAIAAKILPAGVVSGDLMATGTQLGTAIGNGIATAIKALRIGMDAIKGWFASINWGQVGIAVGTGALAFVAGLVVGLFSTEALMQFVGFIADNWVAVLIAVASIAFAPAKLLGAFAKPFSAIISKIPFGQYFITGFNKIVDAIRLFTEPIRQAFHGAVVAPITGSTSFMVSGVRTIINTVRDIILQPFRLAVQSVSEFIRMIPPVASSVVNAIRSYFAPIAAWFRVLFSSVYNAVSSVFNRFIQPASSAFNAVRGVWSNITGFFNGVLSAVQGRVSSAMSSVRSYFSGAWSSVRGVWSAASGFFHGVVGSITGVISSIPGKFTSIFSNALNGIRSMNWHGLGKNIVDGIANGLSPGRVVEKMKSIASSAMDTVKSFLGIASPSKRMRDEVGKMMGAGMAIGIDRSTKDAVKSASNSAKTVMGAYGKSFNASVPTSAQLNSKLDLSVSHRMNDISGRQTPVVVQLDGETLLSFVVDGINGKSFMTNSTILNV